MTDAMLTIIIPIKDKPEIVEECIKGNALLFARYPIFVLDSFGGRTFKNDIVQFYENKDMKFWEARSYLLSKVQTKYVLNLDVDTILPEGYIEKTLDILENNPDVGVVAIDYETLQGHLSFGTSIWRTDLLKEYYNWDNTKRECECIYMWNKVRANGLKVETLPLRAQHLKINRK
jgi:cellulose synthase/poly-beta-1,6-N-acetylglucosamine synthase-like glycosyltransferase